MPSTINILKGLANDHRFRLFLVLLERGLCVCELQEILKMEQSHVSHHLRILRCCGLVEPRQDGRRINYIVTEEVRNNPVVEAIRGASELSPVLKRRIPLIRVKGMGENKQARS